MALASWQHGVLPLNQIVSAGLSPAGIRYRVSAARLHRIHDGVYALVPKALLSLDGQRMAAVLACGSGAALSHHAAIKLRGLMDSSRSRIDVTVPTRGGRGRAGIRIHRSATLRPRDVELVYGIPCTTLARTIFDLAAELTPRRLERLLDEAAYQDYWTSAPWMGRCSTTAGGYGPARTSGKRLLDIAPAAPGPTARSARRCWRSSAPPGCRPQRCSSGSASTTASR